LNRVPEKYRDQAQKKKPPKETEPSPSTDTQEPARKAEPQPAPVKKDLMGRGEEWWRAKAKEWNEKLLNAQKDYEETHQALKDKEQQQEDSKFKPHSQRKKLAAERSSLEEKLKERERGLDEVRNFVEKVLPRQAEELHADPNWLKSKEEAKFVPAPESPPDSKK
jgi:hypothetical protein